MRTSLAPQVIGRCRSRAIRSLSGLRLVVDRLVATKARTAPPQVASERVAAGRNFLWNHNHARDVRWVGRSSLPTDFPDPDRPCERNPRSPHRGFFVSASFARGEAARVSGRKPSAPTCLWPWHRGWFAIEGSKPRRVRHRRAALCDLSGSRGRHRWFCRSKGRGALVGIRASPRAIYIPAPRARWRRSRRCSA